MDLTYSIVKLVLVVVLAAFLIVAIGVDWIGETQGWAGVGMLLGYVVGNVQIAGTAPIIGRANQ